MHGKAMVLGMNSELTKRQRKTRLIETFLAISTPSDQFQSGNRIDNLSPKGYTQS